MNIKKNSKFKQFYDQKRILFKEAVYNIIYTCTRGVRTHHRAARTARIKRQQYTIIACNYNNIIIRTLNEIEFDVFDSDIGFFFYRILYQRFTNFYLNATWVCGENEYFRTYTKNMDVMRIA